MTTLTASRQSLDVRIEAVEVVVETLATMRGALSAAMADLPNGGLEWTGAAADAHDRHLALICESLGEVGLSLARGQELLAEWKEVVARAIRDFEQAEADYRAGSRINAVEMADPGSETRRGRTMMAAAEDDAASVVRRIDIEADRIARGLSAAAAASRANAVVMRERRIVPSVGDDPQGLGGGSRKGGRRVSKGRGPQLSQRELDELDKRKRGEDYDERTVRAASKKVQAQEKFKGAQNRQKRRSDFSTTPPHVLVPAGVAGALGIVWWAAKALSPVCGPHIPVCAVVL